MADQLTPNAIRQLYQDQNVEISNLTVQVVSLKAVGVSNAAAAATAPERWRIIISDGELFITAMLTTQLNHFIQENQIKKNSILRVPAYTVNIIGPRRVVVLLAVEIVQSDYHERIGNPISCDTLESAQKPQSAVLTDRSNNNPAQSTPKPQLKTEEPKPVLPLFRPSPESSDFKPVKPLGARPLAPGYIPIAGLSPFTNKWKIKARVTQKSDIRRWSNNRGEGKLFSVNFLDESGQIKATGFNDAVDNLYDRLVEGKVFLVSRGRITIAKKQFNSLPHDYEIMFENTTEVEECEDESDMPKIQLNKLIKLASLNDVEKDSICDIIAVLKDAGDVSEIVGKQSQKTMVKRDISLLDQSGFLVRLTLWGRPAATFAVPTESIIAFQGVKVGDFGGRCLSMLSSSVMVANPDIPEAFDLKGWYDSEGVTAKTQTYSSMGGGVTRPITEDSLKTISEVKEMPLGTNDRGDYFNCRATIMYIRSETISYPACPTDRCNKKLLQDGDDEWRCEKCERVFPAPDHRYLIQMSVHDYTGNLWVSGFNEVGQAILLKDANELMALQQDDENAFRKVITDATAKTFDLVCRAREETYNDVARIKYSVLRASPVDWASAGLQLAEMLLKTYG
ncbi:hypothetical protein O181_029956 [Austropuccinia psidii MF-1]|uniref:Replication protein A subunit n=1 Tax=Austropuccinia psidii MF-1 TaxID=1389203 RepID=A0A9Q3H3T1_9BASI|nr:hypothetical protein [Austropuccinia psidii MF-1]